MHLYYKDNGYVSYRLTDEHTDFFEFFISRYGYTRLKFNQDVYIWGDSCLYTEREDDENRIFNRASKRLSAFVGEQ
jgi:hypothetical protein